MIKIKKIILFILITLIFVSKTNAEIKDGLFATVGNNAIAKSDIVDEIKAILILNNLSYSDERREELQSVAVKSVIRRNIKKVEIENTKLFKIKIEKIDKKIFEMRGFFGCFVEYDTKNINDIAFLSNNIVQTLSYFGVEKSDILNIIDKDKLKGFDRVVPIGKALEMDMVWDGYQLPYALSRIIN